MTNITPFLNREVANLLNKLGNPESLHINILDTLQNSVRTGIFSNQIINALRIGVSIKEGHQNMALVAPMQSGKTGTIYFLCNYVLPAIGFLSQYESVIFVTSMRDTDLYDQNIKGLEKEYYDAAERTMKDSKIRVFKMSDFFNHPNPYKVVNDYKANIIIRDEDQYGCGEDSSFEGAFFHELKKRISDIKLLAVSATPYDILDAANQGFDVDVIEGFRPKDYYGITEMLEDDLIEDLPENFRPLQVQGKGEEAIYSVHPKVYDYVEYLLDFENGLGIIRESNTNRALNLRNELKKTYNGHCEIIAIGSRSECDYSIDEGLDKVKDLILKMNKRVVLIIVQALTAGKDLGNALKEKVRFGIESRDKQLANGAQGITGRFCGYHKNRDFKVLASRQLLTQYAAFEQDWEVFYDQEWRKDIDTLTNARQLTSQSALQRTQAEGFMSPILMIKKIDYETLKTYEGKQILDFIEEEAYNNLLSYFEPEFYKERTSGTRLRQKGVTVRISSNYNPDSNRVVKNWNCKIGDDFGNVFFKKNIYEFGLLISNYPANDPRNGIGFCGIKIVHSGEREYRSYESEVNNLSMYASKENQSDPAVPGL